MRKTKSTSFLARIISILVLVYLGLVHPSCKQEKRDYTKDSTTNTPVKSNFFAEKLEVKYASKFDLKYFNTYKVLSIINPYKSTLDTLTYVLYQRGLPKPSGYSKAQFIEIPITKFSCVYTTHVAFADFLGATDIINGFASPEYIVNPTVRKKLKEGTISYIGQPDDLNIEKILSIKPDLLMVAGSGVADFNKYKIILESGIGVIVNAEWRENTPLGRAEWVKVFAALLNKESLADEKFRKIEKEYLSLLELTKKIKDKPTVLTGMSYKDAWYIPGGKSFVGNYLRDAGATYPWIEDTTTASFPLDFETVYEKGLDADLWINIEGTQSKKELLEADPRYRDFKPFKQNKLFNNNNRLNDIGGNEYWENGLVNPHIVLADLIKICHPSLLPDHKLYYYHLLR